jgi:hypothetical protein
MTRNLWTRACFKAASTERSTDPAPAGRRGHLGAQHFHDILRRHPIDQHTVALGRRATKRWAAGLCSMFMPEPSVPASGCQGE